MSKLVRWKKRLEATVEDANARALACEARMVHTLVLLGQASEFCLGGRYLVRRRDDGHTESRWVIVHRGKLYTRDGTWIMEPLPHQLNDALRRKTRFTLDDALAQVQALDRRHQPLQHL